MMLDFLFPRHCGVCACWLGRQEGAVCWSCRGTFTPVLRPYCECCGDPVEGRVEHTFLCPFCRARPRQFVTARSAYRFREPFSGVIKNFKYHAALSVVDVLVDGLEACVRGCPGMQGLDGIVPVPLTSRKLRERTFNQSALLGDRLARRLRTEVAPYEALLRVHYSRSQTGLPAGQRRQNVRRAFAVGNNDWIAQRRLLLVDDVMTTGATVDECAATLMAAGAASVHVVTVARG